jgi:hypothetical protein
LEFGVGDGLAIRSFFTDFRELLKAEVELRRTPSTRSSHAMPVAQLLWDRITPAPTLLHSV